MKIWTISDLHLHGDLSTFGDKMKVPDADICVIAGDISDDIEATFPWLARVVRRRMPCVYVLGNHDYLGMSLSSGLKRAQQLADEHDITLLEDSSAVIDGVRFVGSTLWTDFQINAGSEYRTVYDILEAWQRGKIPTSIALKLSTAQDELELLQACVDSGVQINDPRPEVLEVMWLRRERERAFAQLDGKMPEYRSVVVEFDTHKSWITPVHAYALHVKSRAFIEFELARPFDGKTVVVTHHAPHRNSIPSDYFGAAINAAFVSDLSDIVQQHQPAVWIHGHTHCSFDYEVGNSRIVCNPRGNGKGNPAFDWQKIVEVS